MGELLVYKASAGSGKTFTLAVEYIKLLIRSPRAYRQVLAVTFTNKATAEMKERILSQLYGIWTADKNSEAYLNKICLETGKSEEEVRKSAGRALSFMIHDYSRFRVETIDSFFQSVMRNLARELDLNPVLNVDLNNEEVLSDAVDMMIERLEPNSPVLAWLLDYIYEKIANDKRWNVSDEIKKFGWNIFDEGYIEKGAGLRERLKDPHAIRNYRKTLDTMMKEAVEEMKRFAEEFEEELDGHALCADDLKNGSRGIGSYFRKLKEGKFSNDIRNTTVEKCLEDEKNWATKTSSRCADIHALAATKLIPLLQKTESVREQNNRIVNSCRLSMQHLSKLQLLANIDEAVRELNKDNNRFLLSDTNALLHRLIKGDDSSFIFEKIGASIRNVMIDEFQDTSRMQWDNFKILLLEGLSQGASSLIVGDVKQSIYRWRNGDWKILNELNERIGNFPVRVETLNTNRRSEANIIEFNNQVFTQAVDYLNKLYQEQLGEECIPLKRAYQDVVQGCPREEKKGYVKVSFIEPEEGSDYIQQTLISLGEEVKRLVDEGVQLNDIAILVRKNKSIPRIADYFDNELNYKIVSDEAFRLDASLAVCMMVDALRYLSDTNDKIAQAKLAVSYQTEVLKQEKDINAILLKPAHDSLPQEFIDNLSTLRLMPLYELLEELFIIFQMELIEDQDAYLFAFFDAVTEYLQKNTSDLDTFIEYWDDKLCGKTIPSGELEGIRIFSIHKSKGLEFHTVLLPYCDWKLENETNNQLLWCSPEEGPYHELDIVPVTYTSQMAESCYRKDYEQERLQLWVDNLNLLYVAFTRAKNNLLVWSKNKQRNTISEVLYQALSNMANGENSSWDEDGIYEFGELCTSRTNKISEDNHNKLTQKAVKLPVMMETIRPEIKFRQSNRSAAFIEDEEGTSENLFIHRGRLLHTLFSDIHTEADIENAINKLIFEGIIGDRETEEEIRNLTRKAFMQPVIKDWYSGQWKLFNECAILYKEREEIRVRRPDRVMMKGNKVIVTELKFGQQNKRYNRQVQEYINLLIRMGYTNIQGYLWYVEQDIIEEVKPSY